MKYLTTILLFLNALNFGYSQIPNGDFELWDLLEGREKPMYWYCPNLTSTKGPCDKIVKPIDDSAVRIHNVMPCVTPDPPYQFSDKGAGFIETYFTSPYDKFSLSYDLEIDSIEQPAAFVFTLRGKKPDGWSESILTWQQDSLINERVEHKIELLNEYDSLYIQLKAEGLEKIDALHSCDLGYINVIVNNMVINQLVSTKNIKSDNLQIFPNPIDDILTINSTSTPIDKIEVHDIMGKKVFSREAIPSLNFQIDMSYLNLSNPIYFLTVTRGGNSIIKKIIKSAP